MLDKNTKLKVLEYEVLGQLPDLFTFNDGTEVKAKEDWEKRRKELYDLAVVLQYGDLPEPEFLEVEPLFPDNPGTYKIHTGRKDHPVSFTMYYFAPPKSKNTPVIVDGDLCFSYPFNKDFLNAAKDKGISWAWFNRTELAHDVQHEGFKGQLYECYPEYKFGAIRAWAWGYSRCVDALIKLDLIDKDCITFTGHSRGGKTAMLAGVLDKRAAIVAPNETCQGSCSCYRVHMAGESQDGTVIHSETLDKLIGNFDFWLNPDFLKYRHDEVNIPFDSHFLKAMVAPRTLFVSEAVHDIWANPIGSWQTTMAATEAFKFLGVKDNIFWYFRDGSHRHDVLDVQMLVNLICHKKWGEPLNEYFFRRPFDEYPPIYRKLED